MHLDSVREVANIDYDQLIPRTDAGVKSRVNDIISPGISDAERERRATAAGISGSVSLFRIAIC
jgi:hypothetical protein